MSTQSLTADPSHAGALLLLSFATGAADTFAFLLLKGIFTANMTGNLILAGMFTRAEYLPSLLGGMVAITAYAITLWIGLRATAVHAKDSRRQSLDLLTMSVLLQSAGAAVWLTTSDTTTAPRLTVIGLAAGALALQTSAATLISGRYHITTTFITGMLTTLIQDIVAKLPGARLLRIGSLAALAIGALVDTAAIATVTPLAPLLPVIGGIAALGLLLRSRSRPRPTTD